MPYMQTKQPFTPSLKQVPTTASPQTYHVTAAASAYSHIRKQVLATMNFVRWTVCWLPADYDVLLKDAMYWPAALLEDALHIPSIDVLSSAPFQPVFGDYVSTSNPVAYIPQLGSGLTTKMVRSEAWDFMHISCWKTQLMSALQLCFAVTDATQQHLYTKRNLQLTDAGDCLSSLSVCVDTEKLSYFCPKCFSLGLSV